METKPLKSGSNSSYTSASNVESKISSADDGEDSAFICNICLDVTNKDPVVTQCGHLYCWPCLYRWLNTNHTTCPVCKAGVSKENIIPLFIRGSEEDPRTKNPLPDGVPNRPQGRRPEPQAENLGMNGANFNMQYGGLTISAGFGFFPSLFGLQFQNIPISASSSNTAPNTDEAQNLQLSRILIVLGIVVIMALLFF